MIRRLLPDDVAACVPVQHAAFYDLDVRMGRTPHEFSEEIRTRSLARVGHLQRTDPDSAWVAEENGEITGCGLAMVRDGMWFLSLLVVSPEHQGKGIGKQLLDATLVTATDRSWIMSTVEPAAMRRYQRAGFELHPTYTAKGAIDRAKLPAVHGIRDFQEQDRETLDKVLTGIRGAAMGPEVDYLLDQGARIVVAPGKGFSALRNSGTFWLAATDEDTARDLLWTTLAEATDESVEVDWLAANQQWGIDVCLEARLSLKSNASLALRGQPTMVNYLPCGAFG